MLIESPANPRLRALAGLRDRRARLAAGLSLVDGRRECARALSGTVTVETAIVCDELVRDDEARSVVETATRRGIEVLHVGERAFRKVAFGDRDDGVILVVRIPDPSLAGLRSVAAGAEPLIVVTEDVEKPGNVGAIIRSADGAGANAVIAVGGTDLYNPNVIRASVGTIFHVPVAAGSSDEVLGWLRENRFRVLVARVGASAAYTAADLRGRVALVLGSEAEGLTRAWDAEDVEPIGLPMAGTADSLNVSVTAAILLYEARRQRMEGR